MDKLSKDKSNEAGVAAQDFRPEVDEMLRELRLIVGLPSDDPKWLSRKLVGEIAACSIRR